jgi:hypothetical protein
MELEVNLGSVCFWLFFLWCSAYWRLCFVVLLFSTYVRLVQIPIFNNNNIFAVKKNLLLTFIVSMQPTIFYESVRKQHTL